MTAPDDATDPRAPVRLGAAEIRRSVATLLAGATIDAYEIVELIGIGGMGEVYRARDHRLARDVALKVLRPGALAEGAELADGWLVREAQALARLHHPNVVAVHEVGRFEGQGFVAMEYVAGRSLRAWLADEPRTPAAIVAHFTEAGRGLAAAHHADLVHRDFKPDNVLVGDDGRVRVTDFGLAAPATDDDAVAGTPAYMAPEQHAGGVVDARADQFGFCVALYEALYGERPFAAGDRDALVAAVGAGQIRAAPAGSTVPAWLRAIAVRGLAIDPAARFASMDALLAALADDPAVRRRRALARTGVGVLAIVAVAGVVVFARGPRVAAPSCRAGDPRLAAVWNPGARERITAAFTATGRAYAGERAAHVVRAIDRYAVELVAMRTEACVATAIRHDQSPALLDLRTACLDRRVDQLAALVTVLAETDTDVGAHALDAVEQLEPLATCADAAALTAVVPPGDPALRPLIDRVHGLIDRADALQHAGSYTAGLVLADVAVVVARKIGYAPLRANAAFSHAALAERVGYIARARADLDETLESAAAGHDDHRTAAAWTLLIFLLGDDQGQLDEALALVPAARAAVARVGDAPADRMALYRVLGLLLQDKGRLDEAIVYHQREIELVLATQGETDRAARAYEALAGVLSEQGRLAEAQAAAERGLAIARASVGDHHPATAALWSMRGRIETRLGRTAEAQADLEHALAIERDVLGPDSARAGADLANLAIVLGHLGRIDEAKRMLDEALAINEHAVGVDHPMVAQNLLAFGQLLDANRRAGEAVPLLARALAISEHVAGTDSIAAARAHGALAQAYQDLDQLEPAELHARAALAGVEHTRGLDSGEVVEPLYVLAELRESRGDSAGAVEDLTRAIAIADENADDPLGTAVLLTTLGEMQVDRGRAADAVAPLERAAAIHAHTPPAPSVDAATKLALGQALWDSGRDRARGLALVRASYAEYAVPDFAPERAQITAWMKPRKLTLR